MSTESQRYQALEWQWYQALYEADCIKVMKLLEEDPRLVKVGWKSQLSMEVSASPGSRWVPKKPSPWKGRTALHVGARRGCVKLIEQVLSLCKLEGIEYKSPMQGGRKSINYEYVLSDIWRSPQTEPFQEETSDPADRGGMPDAITSEGDHQPKLESAEAAQTPSSDKLPGLLGQGELEGANRKDKDIAESPQNASASSQVDQESMRQTAQSASQNTSVEELPQNLEKATVNDDKRPKTSPWKKVTKATNVQRTISRLKQKVRNGNKSSQEKPRFPKHGPHLSGFSEDHSNNLDTPSGDSIHKKELRGLSDSHSPSPSDFGEDHGHDLEKISRDLDLSDSHSPSPSGFGDDHRHDLDKISQDLGLSDSHSPSPSGFGENHSHDFDKISRDLKSKADLRALLLSKDGEYELDALAMATLTGNENVIRPLVYAIGECDSSPYEISRTYISRDALQKPDKRNRARLREATDEVIKSFAKNPIFRTQFLDEYARHPDFNFLPREEYLYHFSFTSCFRKDENWEEPLELRTVVRDFQKRLHDNVRSRQDDELWRYLWELQDGQGRPPAHVAVDEHNSEPIFQDWRFGDLPDAFSVPDGAGRSFFHRAAALGDDTSEMMLYQLQGLDMLAVMERWRPLTRGGLRFFSGRELSSGNGFRYGHVELTPIHAAIIHKRTMFWAMCIIKLGRLWDKTPDKGRLWDQFLYRDDFDEANLMELSCALGEEKLVSYLLENGRQFAVPPNEYQGREYPGKEYQGRPTQTQPALHIAASIGNSKIVELLLKDPDFDPFIKDSKQNNVLHHAMKLNRSQFKPHLLDYVGCEHLRSRDMRKVNKEKIDDTVERQGCVNLLLQAGCDIFTANEDGEIPNPERALGEKFMSWWYERQTREFATIQNNMNIAANAISVTAALVATASYVGPLQPPLGLGKETGQIQYENGWVATFIFCDTLSFYLAIVAIILSLIPSLPMPQQSMKDELRRTRKMVTMAVGALFPSVLCVLIAFASSSMAVVSANILSGIGGKLTVSTLCIGVPLIVGAFILFIIRLLGIWFPRNARIKYLYKLTSF